jgi:hypothetical protein
MSRRKLASGLVVLTAIMVSSVRAEDEGSAANAAPPLLTPPPLLDQPAPVFTRSQPSNEVYSAPVSTPATNISAQTATFVPPTPIDANLAQANAAPPMPAQQQGYVRLGAPLYPTPRPNIPAWTGSTVITNQAFAPQEMLYPHTYRAIYPPFYHRVKGGWIVTPTGVRSHERWELQGTQVEVKYRSSYPGLLSGAFWHPPAMQYQSGHCR